MEPSIYCGLILTLMIPRGRDSETGTKEAKGSPRVTCSCSCSVVGFLLFFYFYFYFYFYFIHHSPVHHHIAPAAKTQNGQFSTRRLQPGPDDESCLSACCAAARY